MRVGRWAACFALLAMLTACGASRPVDGGYTAGIAKPKLSTAERLDAARADYQRGLRWYADQDNSCNRQPSQTFPAANCSLSAAQIMNLATNLKDAEEKLNAATVAYNAWVEAGSKAGEDKTLLQLLIIAENAVAQFKVPNSFVVTP